MSRMGIMITQTELNKYGYDLLIDGILGPMTIDALSRFLMKIVSLMEDNGYIIDAQMVIGLRDSLYYDNLFSDTYLYLDNDELTNSRLYPMSTKPGIDGKGNILDPIWVRGKYGVAVMKAGQYIDAYTLQGPWWSGYSFLHQTGEVTIYRDGNKDFRLDKKNIQTGLFGINHHSWTNYNYDKVNNLSRGCQVFQSKYIQFIKPHWKLLSNVKKQITYTLLEL